MKRGGIQDGILQCYFSSKVPTFLTMFFILHKPLRCDLSMHSAMQVNVVTKVFKIILSGQIISWILHSIYNFLHIINKNNVFNSYSCIVYLYEQSGVPMDTITTEYIHIYSINL